MAEFDVVVIGGGPAGFAAALRSAERGARVALIEAERPGGACVHFACLPTNILLGAAAGHIEARELGIMGVFEVGNEFNFGRAVARKNALVKRMADGIAAALRMRKVQVITGRAAFTGPATVEVASAEGPRSLTAEAFVVATGTRWEPQPIANFPSDRLVTPDGVQNLTVAPASALVLGGGAGDADFGVEYAFLLAAAGSEVTMVTPGRLLPALDGTVADFARAALADAGVRLLEGADVAGVEVGGIAVAQGGQRTVVAADLVVAADPRRPFYEPLNLAAAGVVAGPSALSVDRSCRTNVAHIYAAGDVTGQVMLSSSATHMGEVAGENATGGQASIRLARPVHLLHTTPEIGWVGLSEEAAKDAGREVKAGTFDLSFNARAIVAGAREGIVKVVADCRLGEVLGVHAAGPGCAEILNVASALLQAEATVHDLAASVFWHPSMAEGLAEAARRAL